MMRAKFAYQLLKQPNNKTNLARSDNFDLYELLKYNIKNRKLVTSILLTPYMVAPIAVGLSWRLIWDRDLGLANFFCFSLDK